VIAVTPDFRVGPRCRIDVFLLLVGRKSGQLKRSIRVQDRITFRAVSAGAGATATAGRLTALAAGRTGPAGRRGHG